MSVEAMSWVLGHSRSTMAARLVAISIASHADKVGLNSWPSQKTIAKETHLTVLSVRKAIRKLVHLRELKAVPPSKIGRASHYIYALPLVSSQRELLLNQPADRHNKGIAANPISKGNGKGVSSYRDSSPQIKGKQLTPNCPEPSYPKRKTPRDTPARSTPLPEQEQKRRIEGRERRVMQEVGILQDNLTCMGPGLEPEIERTVFRIADKMKSLEPLSQAEYERRRDDQKRRLGEYLKKTAGG